MPFNSTDFTKAPWAPGVMTLTHEECVDVLEKCREVAGNYDPSENYYDPMSDFYVQSEYNKIDWTRGINGETYAVLKGYDPERHTLGIDENGIVREAPEGEEQPEETPEAPADEPAEEAPAEPEAPAEDEAPTGDDEQAGE